MKFIIDMNLSPEWVATFEENGYEAQHWSRVGDVKAIDSKIMDWAKKNKHIVFTHDLDFGTILAVTKTKSPSVIQVRTQEVLPENLANRLFPIIKTYESELKTGVLLTLDEAKHRIRLLPI
jgi:predicted nuclease of predicted toxin-antitoxin system